MTIPTELRAAIDEQIAKVNPAELIRAARELSNRYRAGQQCASVLSMEAARAAYVVTRMPATFAATRRALAEIAGRLPITVRSVLDLGSGPGTVAWAAVESFTDIEQITVVERDAGFIEIGRQMAGHSTHAALQRANWIRGDMREYGVFGEYDLVVSSYAVGELGSEAYTAELARRMWKLARMAVVVIEPGTPNGFQHVLAARTALIEAGAKLVAPCPHEKQCPMAAAGDWCHFAQRLERSAEHRRAKGGELGYEDEKFSYVSGVKVDADQAAARIVRHPMRHSGHVQLTLCAPGGLVKRTVTKSQKDKWSEARQAKWGDAWEE